MNTQAHDNIHQLLLDQINDNDLDALTVLTYADAEDDVCDLIASKLGQLSNDDLSSAICKTLADKCDNTQLDSSINNAVEEYNHNLPDVLEIIIQTTHREFMSYGFDEKVFANMTRGIIENLLENAGYNADEIIGILNT